MAFLVATGSDRARAAFRGGGPDRVPWVGRGRCPVRAFLPALAPLLGAVASGLSLCAPAPLPSHPTRGERRPIPGPLALQTHSTARRN